MLHAPQVIRLVIPYRIQQHRHQCLCRHRLALLMQCHGSLTNGPIGLLIGQLLIRRLHAINRSLCPLIHDCLLIQHTNLHHYISQTHRKGPKKCPSILRISCHPRGANPQRYPARRLKDFEH